MLSLGIGEKDWEPETFKTIALNGEGVGEFVETLERHRRYLLGIASKGLI